MRIISAAICLLLSCNATAATIIPNLADLDMLPLNSATLSLEERATAKRALADNQSRIFAVSASFPLVSLNDGSWDFVADDVARWRTRVYSAGATSLNLALTNLALPDTAQLWFYDANGRTIQGPYTSKDVSTAGELWTALVPGEIGVIELRVALEQRSSVHLQLAQINHGIRTLSKAFGLGESGSCNIDVVCPLGDDWREEIRSAALITVDGKSACSGQLVNNTRSNQDPLFLTADHCGIGDADGGPAASVVIYWNYETSSCSGAPDGKLDQNQSGTTLLADDIGSDFTLLRLNQAPSTAFNVYFAGWDASGKESATGVGIHHPSGDVKRISAYSDTTTQATVCIESNNQGQCTRLVDSWRVTWSQGTTEQGSSGSGLWNAERRIIGVLSGGSASCSNPGAPDFYGRLSEAWTANASDSGQLKAWLDPDDTGASTFDGMNPDTASVPTPTPTPTTTPTPTATPAPSGGGGGGGAFGGGMGLLLLSVLVMLRHRRAN